jgi:5'-nucleotidase/UDP-sugar diphosphatase
MKRRQVALWYILLFLLFTTFACAQSSEIRILHVNDFHGFVEPYKPLGSDKLLGGVAYLAAKANEL